jgi:oxygen-dependent protoporphyrinogen oxidase
MKHVVILGAGISGLAAGWFLKQKYPSLSITILEKSSRCGGWIKSVQTDGFLFELGPRSCRPSARTLQLIQDLHLQNEVLPGHAQAKIRYLYRHQRLQALPQNFLSLMCSSLLPTVIKGAAKDLLTKRSLEEDETIESFVTRRLGPTIAHELFDPLTTGIYAGDMRQLSMKACFPQIYEWEQKKGSLIRGALSQPKPKMQTSFERQLAKGSLFSFKKGMETLTEALAKKLERHIWLDTSVHRLPFDRADHVISALPAQALGSLLSKEHPAIAHQLSSFESESITVVNLGFHNRILAQEGFGYLIPRLENEDILGVVFDSSVFPEQGLGTRLTVMIKQQVENPVDVALRSLHKHLGIQRIPDTYYVHRALQAIPQYKVGHTEKVRKIEEMIRMQGLPLSLLGSAFNGVSVNDCIANAYQLVDSFNLKSS